MNSVDFNWKWGRVVMGGPTALMTRLHVYGKERMPREGGIVESHASDHRPIWIDLQGSQKRPATTH